MVAFALSESKTSNHIGAVLMDILVEAGVPAGVLNFLPGFGEDVGAHLVGHKQVDFIAFTAVAFRFGLPVAHVVALPCLTGAYLMAWFLSGGLLRVPDDEVPARSDRETRLVVLGAADRAGLGGDRESVGVDAAHAARRVEEAARAGGGLRGVGEAVRHPREGRAAPAR